MTRLRDLACSFGWTLHLHWIPIGSFTAIVENEGRVSRSFALNWFVLIIHGAMVNQNLFTATCFRRPLVSRAAVTALNTSKLLKWQWVPLWWTNPGEATPLGLGCFFGNGTRLEYELNRHLWCLTAQSVIPAIILIIFIYSFSLFSRFDRVDFMVGVGSSGISQWPWNQWKQ
jgi:hypothetical protein